MTLDEKVKAAADRINGAATLEELRAAERAFDDDPIGADTETTHVCRVGVRELINRRAVVLVGALTGLGVFNAEAS